MHVGVTTPVSSFLVRAVLPIVALVVGACSDSGPPLEKASLCSGAWQPLTAPRPYDITSPLVYRDGVLYYSYLLESSSKIVALPAAGGEESTMAPAFAWDLWLEGDHLLYVDGDGRFFSLPFDGGSPELLLDSAAGQAGPVLAWLYNVSATDFFWAESVSFDAPTTVWRASRSGGTPIQIGTVSARTTTSPELAFSKMAISGDSVILSSILGISDAVPFDGSPSRVLAAPDAPKGALVEAAGVDGTGAYWSVLEPGPASENDAWPVMLAPADGSPIRTFWQGLPGHSMVDQVWPDGTGGWVLAASQLFDDQQYHSTIWLLAADGTSRRLACSPGRFIDGSIEVRPAVALDAVFAIVRGDTWQIVRIPR